MATPFLAEIRIFGFNFPPTGWAYCNGQIMPISQNTALFALLGTTYGGDGKSTFALPNLQDSVPIGANLSGPPSSLTAWDLGTVVGSSTVTLIQTEIPAHTHTLNCLNAPANLAAPGPTRAVTRSSPGLAYAAPGTGDTAMAFQSLAPAGASLPHNNMMPYLVVNYCIALQGVFPPRP